MTTLLGFTPLFRDCAEAALYGSHLRLDGAWMPLKLDGSTRLGSAHDFGASCDNQGWMTVLARDAGEPNKLVGLHAQNMNVELMTIVL